MVAISQSNIFAATHIIITLLEIFTISIFKNSTPNKMKYNLLLIASVLLATFSHAQQFDSTRPQTPLPPFPYHSDSVEYDNADKSIHYGATLTYPNQGGPFVTLLMITGSGQQDRDETIFRHHPFAVIADYLTRHGYAVLRVDDRQKGKSTGDLKNATSADFANDVQNSFNYLLTRPEADHKKIGLCGHSEGGLIEVIVASREPRVSFLISMAGPGISGAEILLAQQTDPVKGLVSDSAFNAYYSLTRKTLQLIHNNPQLSDSALQQKIEDWFGEWKGQYPTSVLQPLHADKATPKQYGQQMKTELLPWFRFFITTEPTDYWEKVKCPVLAIDGEKDIQVNANENIPIIARALQLSGDQDVTTKIFPGLNHLFQLCSKCTVPEYNEIKQTISPDVLAYIGDWLDKNIHKTTP